jgi:transcriptional regulator with XRE-family HTH domain
LTQVQLAKAVDVSQSAVAQWESGRSFPSERVVRRLEKLLDMKIAAAEGKRRSDRELQAAVQRRLLPITGSPIPDDPELILLDDRVYGQIPAPPRLEWVDGATAIYGRSQAMEPRYFPGELIYLHPRRHPILDSVFRGTQALRPTLDLNLADDLQALAVKAQDRKRILDHVLREQGLSVTAPNHTLIPSPDLGFGYFGEVRSIHAEDDDQTVVIVERMVRRAGRAVLRREGDIVPVIGERQTLDNLPDIERSTTRGAFPLRSITLIVSISPVLPP